MNADRPDLVVTATITPHGQLTVWGLDPSPRVLDEGFPKAARNELANLLQAHALATAQAVCAAARTPAGPPGTSPVDATGVSSPLDPSHFADVILPDLDPG